MGKSTKKRVQVVYKPTTITREPRRPSSDWPRNHIEAKESPIGIEECIEVTIHGVKHYIHAATAQALVGSLTQTLMDWESKATNELGRPPLDWEYMKDYLIRIASPGKSWNRWNKAA